MQIDDVTIGDAFDRCVEAYGERPFLIIPPAAERGDLPDGLTLSFREMAQHVTQLTRALEAAGYGHGHRVACLIDNRPEMLIAKLACARLGITWVPVNPDYRAAETAYLIADAQPVLLIASANRQRQAEEAIAVAGRPLSLCVFELGQARAALPRCPTPAPIAGPPQPETDASLLYTSGTTGRPKGCRLGHTYELMMGETYATLGGRLALDPAGERIYCPLPLFHVNAAILLFYCAMLSGSAMIVPERFSRTRFWADLRTTKATAMHYLGVIIPVLMSEPAGPQDRDHTLKWGIGAGVEPGLQIAFEARFGVPLVEVWGMTEMCRLIADCHEPRTLGQRAFGRPRPGLEARVVDEHDVECPRGVAGEMVVRHSTQTPRKGAFSGYLNLPDATEQAWRGGWFHTGDIVRQDESGMLYFVDRKKNIIRRSGENIAAAEVEACLQDHPAIAQVAVLAVADELRDEEVMACVVLREGARQVGTLDEPMAEAMLARALFDHTFQQLAYYKAPGWVLFVDALPVTGTQKVVKHQIFRAGEDPRTLPRVHDLRALKKR